MHQHRIIIYGNSGSGKTTMGRELVARYDVPLLLLDEVAWVDVEVRKPLEQCAAELNDFFARHNGWIVEGCYGELVEIALPRCTELRFLNPGVEACVENCRKRPWEPDKYGSMEEQNDMLETLIDWVHGYPSRDDDCGLKRHVDIFAAFDGPKQEFC